MEYQKYLLRDIGDIVSGATPKTAIAENFGGDIPWLTPADLSGYTQKYISCGARNLTKQGYDSCSTQIMPTGTVLFSSRAPIGYVAIAKNPICTNQGFKSIVPKSFINSEFLYYQLIYLRKTIQDMGSGTTFKEISATKFGTVQVTVPPLPEQERIVSRIEELFSQLDASVAELKTAKERLKVYRQAVLKEAFDKIENSVPMSKVATMIDPQPSHRTPPEVEGGIPYIGIGDIDYKHDRIMFESARKVSPMLLEEHRNRYKITSGDFIMGKIGTIGKPFRLKLPQNYTLSANVILIQHDSKKILPEFLFWQFSSPLITTQLSDGAVATSQAAFGIKKARNLSIKICPLSTQKVILGKLEEKMSVCDSIEKTVDTALQQAEALRQSILKKAFEGGFYNE